MAYVRCQLRNWTLIEGLARRRADTRVYTRILLRWCVRREEQRVEHLVRRTGYAKLAVLDISAEINTNLKAVVAMAHRYHVRVRVDVVLKELRIARIGAESGSSVVQRSACADLGYTWD